MNSLTGRLLVFMAALFIIQPIEAQKSSKKAGKDFSVVYESGNHESGYSVRVMERKNQFGDYEYYIERGNKDSSRMNGFGSQLFINTREHRVDFSKRLSDSASVVFEINQLPQFNVGSDDELNMITLKTYYYYIGLYKENVIVKGRYYNTLYKEKFEGLFDVTFGRFDYGAYSNQYLKDTVMKGFLWNPGRFPANYAFRSTGLRYYILDTFLNTVPYYQDELVKDLYPFPVSEYNAQRKTVNHLRYNNGSYTGEAYNGKPEGVGEWVSDDGEFVEYGYFKNGKPHGLFCKNIVVRNATTLEDVYFTSPRRPMKGIVMGIFNNGVPKKMYVDCGGLNYSGAVNDRYEPHGQGKAQYRCYIETGIFSFGKLDGYGTRIHPDKSVTSGYFKNGQLVTGSFKKSVSSLQQYDVVLVKGKRLMVLNKKWWSSGAAYAEMSDGTTLMEGDPFEMYKGDDSDFYTQCQTCNGTGVLVQTNTYKFWIGNDVLPSKRVERIGGKDYLRTSVEFVPKYMDHTTTSKKSCMSCGGKGRRLVDFK